MNGDHQSLPQKPRPSTNSIFKVISMKYQFAILITLVLFASIGCKEGEDGESGEGGEVRLREPTVWTLDSERLVIRENRDYQYTFYDFSRDTLPANVKAKLYNLHTTDTGIICRAEGETYQITITDNDGLDRIYASADGHCDDTYPMDTFISVTSISNVVTLLKEIMLPSDKN